MIAAVKPKRLVQVIQGLEKDIVYERLPLTFGDIEEAEQYINRLIMEKAAINSLLNVAERSRQMTGEEPDKEWVKNSLYAIRFRELQIRIIEMSIIRHVRDTEGKDLLGLGRLRDLEIQMDRLTRHLYSVQKHANRLEADLQAERELSKEARHKAGLVEGLARQLTAEKEKRMRLNEQVNETRSFTLRSLYTLAIGDNSGIDQMIEDLGFVEGKGEDWGRKC